MSLKFLVLTDHAGHSEQNSIYALVSALARDPRCARVDVASRGDTRNDGFFSGAGTQVHGLTVKQAMQFDASGRQFTQATGTFHPKDYDILWLRLPHPVAFDFLEGIDASVMVINDPAGIEETGNKAYLLNFPEFTAPCRLVSTAAEVRDLPYPAVLKPLRAYGGQGIVRLQAATATVDGRQMPLEDFLAEISEPYLAMKFLKNVSEGDKRILVVNGKILAASLRLPAPGNWLCNVAQGGTSVGAEVTPDERAMIEAIAPTLLEKGVCFFGADTLVNDDGKRVLSELNTLSIGGFPQAEAQTGRPVVQLAVDELFNFIFARVT